MSNKKLIRIISIYEIIGGLLGIITILIFVFTFPQSSKILFSIFAAIAYLLSFFAGLFLWKMQKRGIILSIWIQLLQLPKLIIAGFYYSFLIGLEFSSSFTTTGTSFTVGAGNDFNISYNTEETSFLIGFNIIALIIIIYLKEILRKNPFNIIQK